MKLGRRVVSALVVVVLGCGGGKGSEDCGNDAWELSKLLESADRDAVDVGSIKLVERSDLPKLGESPHVPVILVGKDIIVGGRVTDPAGLAARLDEVRAQITSAKQAGVPQHRAIVAVDATATWSEVVAVTEALQTAYYDEPAFAFARPSTKAPPPKSDVDAQLDAMTKLGPSERAMELAKVLKSTISSCSSLTKLFGHAASIEGNKDAFIISNIGPALVDCSCKVEMPALRSILWRLFAGNQPTSAVQTALASTGTAIELPASTPWSEASKQLTSTTKSVVLRIAAP